MPCSTILSSPSEWGWLQQWGGIGDTRIWLLEQRELWEGPKRQGFCGLATSGVKLRPCQASEGSYLLLPTLLVLA